MQWQKRRQHLLFRFSLEENKTQNKRLRNQTRKVVARALRKEAKRELNNLDQNSNSFFASLEQ